MGELDSKKALHVLCLLTLEADDAVDAIRYVADLDTSQREAFLALADAHHVLMRGLSRVVCNTCDPGLSNWAAVAMADEHQRIQHALKILHAICAELEDAGCPVTVMKSLDHWPDLGNDLDLFTTADERHVIRVMAERFGAQIEARSWGDRLANKWNFAVPGLPEVLEVHVQRLGQTGEHIRLARRFITRRMRLEIAGYTFLVPAPEERVIEATLQRMYRHFYFRVCDIVDTAALVCACSIDYDVLRDVAQDAGIWPGVATFLRIVADWTHRYGGQPLPLPREVIASSRFGGDTVYVGGKFLRIPTIPHGAQLYGSEVMRTISRGDFPAALRLSLLPPLASAAAVAYRLTGSDKGVW